jgi:hypothetical protein
LDGGSGARLSTASMTTGHSFTPPFRGQIRKVIALVKANRSDAAIELAKAAEREARRAGDRDAASVLAEIAATLKFGRRALAGELPTQKTFRCRFCGKRRQGRLIALLGVRIAVCRTCAMSAARQLNGRRVKGKIGAARLTPKGVCQFCYQSRKVFVGVSPRATMCGGCAAIAAEARRKRASERA